jgi:predicted ATP-dependent endonuclease of OLD family
MARNNAKGTQIQAPLARVSSMFIEELSIEGYKSFGEPFAVQFRKGLNVLMGENAVGKSAIIDAIRLLLLDDDSERKPISDSDFFLPFAENKERAKAFRIQATFGSLSPDQQVAFLPWTDLNGKGTLTLLVENKQNPKGRYKPTLWGGASRASMFERELFDTIDCVYLPPLRDAEARLREGKSSRLARLLKNLNRQLLEEAKGGKRSHPLEVKVKEFNKSLSSVKDEHISEANKLIQDRLTEAIGSTFGQDTQIKFTEANFNRIVESLRLFFFPVANSKADIDAFRSLEENSLGYNNLLYIATVLAELTQADEEVSFKVLLIEEPEAHLHPQFQIRLLKYLEKQADCRNVQVIITTHSPVLASAASVDALVHVSRKPTTDGYTYTAVRLEKCGLPEPSKRFLSRWLDVTKSTLLFARGVILVEGIAEAMLLPELAKRILKTYNKKQEEPAKRLPESLEDAGVSVINIGGVYFRHFMQLFCNVNGTSGENVPVRCSGATDKDPPKESKPTPDNPVEGKNPALGLESSVNSSRYARLFCSPLKTLEYDLAMQGDNLSLMLNTALSIIRSKAIKGHAKIAKKTELSSGEKAEAAFALLKVIQCKRVGKGLFAQTLCDRLADTTIGFAVPAYIRRTVIWACGGNPDDT